MEGEEEAEEEKASYDKTTMPEFLFSFEADDAFLKARIMNLPENVVVGTHNTEKDLIRRLSDYRSLNSEETTVLNYFDELEVHPIRIGK
jgi:adenylate kinase